MRARLTHLSGEEEKVSRGGFLRRAGVAGLALAGIGELVAAPLASAKTGRVVAADVPLGTCNGYSVCNRCNGCCGSPCTPRGVSYCYYCTSSSCLNAGTYCFSQAAQSFHYCCN